MENEEKLKLAVQIAQLEALKGIEAALKSQAASAAGSKFPGVMSATSTAEQAVEKAKELIDKLLESGRD